MRHGGKRLGAGSPEVNIDGKRVMTFISQGVSQRDIAQRFGVSQSVIWYRVQKLTRAQ